MDEHVDVLHRRGQRARVGEIGLDELDVRQADERVGHAPVVVHEPQRPPRRREAAREQAAEVPRGARDENPRAGFVHAAQASSTSAGRSPCSTSGASSSSTRTSK